MEHQPNGLVWAIDNGLYSTYNAYRLRWTPGAIVFWDNRSTQHYAANDYYPERRRMERTAVIGDVPV